ncbi:sarcosine oxidase [Pseudarcicella hirudinis]|uniref:Sarcosine oxidase n=2 Tax=Pseudarcicella hirudinis TaxID=1079859 RepID=A0A1I5MHM9_9BACT|nr:FAD-dependent oxidoreductase [Pseudarcicella hirudinis]SFP09138.1 sarcosine oxidase [Pseudarcicella hirudinis]
MKTHYDVIVIGGGPMGLATSYQLGKRKASVLVLERFKFLNQQGSSAGFSRQYRIPYPDEYMVNMALEAQPYWDELQTHTPKTLMDKVGTLWFGDPNVHSTEGNIAAAEKAMDAAGVKYTTLTSKEVEDQYHFRNLPSNYTGLFQADGASIDLVATLETLHDLNLKSPSVTLKEFSPVYQINQIDGIFHVTTPEGTHLAKKLVITPGPYINNVLNLLNFKVSVTYWEMASAYFKKTKPDIQYPTWFVFQEAVGENGNQFYGFPEVTWDYPGYIRVAPDFVIKPLTSPDQRTSIPNPQELAYTAQWVKDHMTGLDPTPYYTSTCLIALSNLKNKELLLDFAPDFVPNNKDIVIYATGWAAKFIPLLGEILSQLTLDGTTPYDIEPFQLGYKYFKSIL